MKIKNMGNIVYAQEVIDIIEEIFEGRKVIFSGEGALLDIALDEEGTLCFTALPLEDETMNA